MSIKKINVGAVQNDGTGDPVLKAGAQKVPDGVQYDRIVVPLIACVQAQRRQIEALEMRVAALEVPR